MTAPTLEQLLQLVEEVEIDSALGDKTDSEIADVLLVYWSELPLGTPQELLVSQAIDRLRRAGGGAMPMEPTR